MQGVSTPRVDNSSRHPFRPAPQAQARLLEIARKLVDS